MTKAQETMQIWMLLVCAAKEGKNYAYSDIGEILNLKDANLQNMGGKYLDPIRSYCDKKGYPPLDVLVVNKNTGVPGKGYKPRKTVAQDKADVYEYKHNWFAIEPPQISDFENAVKNKRN